MEVLREMLGVVVVCLGGRGVGASEGPRHLRVCEIYITHSRLVGD